MADESPTLYMRTEGDEVVAGEIDHANRKMLVMRYRRTPDGELRFVSATLVKINAYGRVMTVTRHAQ